ncbi:hypothetical protein ZOSMA_182G00560 [Zostera marina]|uniref:DUF4408 domain-containing protein n=1 Tax=Zostera marina TaxID=29655 RepID=A0A0K9PT00_ZOSMR|nr:hypothetical protein ZOSMA_182G00560 [Zostera marina]
MMSELVVPESAIWVTVSSWFTPRVLFVVLNIVIGTIAIRSKLSNTSQSDDGNRIEGGGEFEFGHDDHYYQPRLLSRGSSIVARLKSINLHRHVSSAFAPFTTETLQPPPSEDAVRSKLSNTSQSDDGNRIEGGGEFEFGHDGHYYQPRLLSRGSSIVARLKSINLHRHVSSVFAPFTTETLQQPPSEDAVTTSDRKEEIQKEPEMDQVDSDSVLTMEEAYMAAKRGNTNHSLSLQNKVVMQELRKSVTKTATAKEKAKLKAKAARVEEDEVDARADDFINRFKKQLQLQRMESLDRLKKMISRGTEK